MVRSFLNVVTGCTVGVFLGCSAAASDLRDRTSPTPFISFTLASHHLNADRNFNEYNPGIGVGFTIPAQNSDWIFGVEAGTYRNSHKDQSHYILGSLERPVAQLGERTELKLGLMAGVARYREVANDLREKGIPTVGDWVLAGGATAAINYRDRVEFRAGVVPAPGVADAIFTFQMRIPLR